MDKEGWRVIVIGNTLVAKPLTHMVLNSVIRRQHFGGCHVFFTEVASGSEKLRFIDSE